MVYLQAKMDSIATLQKLQTQVYAELKTQYPGLKNAILQPVRLAADSTAIKKEYLVVLSVNRMSATDKKKIKKWLRVRLQQPDLQLIINP